MGWAEHVDGIGEMYHAESKQCATPLLCFFVFFYEQSQTEGWKCLNRLNYSSFCFTICFFSLKEGAREHCRLQLFCSLRLLRFLFVRVGVCGLFYAFNFMFWKTLSRALSTLEV